MIARQYVVYTRIQAEVSRVPIQYKDVILPV